MTKPKRSRRPNARTLYDALGPTLEGRTRAWLRDHPPPDNEDEFDRICREAMTRYVDLLDDIRARPPQNAPRTPGTNR